MTADALDIQAGRLESGIESHGEILKKTEITENIRGHIPRKGCFDIDNIRANDKFHVVIINPATGAGDYAGKWAFRAVDNFQSDRCADVRVEQAIIRACINDGFETFAGSVVVDDLNG